MTDFRVVIAEDNPQMMALIQQMLEDEKGFCVVGMEKMHVR